MGMKPWGEENMKEEKEHRIKKGKEQEEMEGL